MTFNLRWAWIDNRSGVYIVSFGIYGKIGFSRHIGKRLRTLEEGLPLNLTLHRMVDGATLADEADLHRRFADVRTKNEWYRLEEKFLGFAGRETVAPFFRDHKKSDKPNLYLVA